MVSELSKSKVRLALRLDQLKEFLAPQLGDQLRAQLVDGLPECNIYPILFCPAVAHPLGQKKAVLPVQQGKPQNRGELTGVALFFLQLPT